MKLKLAAKLSLLAALPVCLCQAQPVPALLPQTAAFRFLQQASWGPTPATVAQVQQSGFYGYLVNQFAAPLSPITDVPVDMANGSGSTHPVRSQFFYNAAVGEDQLRQRMVFALGKIFVVSTLKVNTPNSITNLQRIFQKDAFGNFRDLLYDVTLSPAMGRYLDMVNSRAPATGSEADQNYARELLQLFTIGTTQIVGGNAGQPSYGQTEVDGFARAFTGWEFGGQQAAAWTTPMVPVPAYHDVTAKTLLTYGGVVHTLPANQSAKDDLNQALDVIFNDPDVGYFISLRLIQQFVTSSPSFDYVARVALAFNGTNVTKRGDMQQVIRAILLDPEARAGDSAAPSATEGHLKEPILALTNYIRETGATVATDNNFDLIGSSLDQGLFAPPSVFSFFSPQYVVPGNPPVNAPEFQILTGSDAVNRTNVMSKLVYSPIVGQTNNLSQYDSLAANPSALVAQLNTDLMGGTMRAGMQAPIFTYMSTFPAAHEKVLAAVYLITSSWQWQVVR